MAILSPRLSRLGGTLEEIDSYENPLGEGYHTHLTLCTRQHCFPIHLFGRE